MHSQYYFAYEWKRQKDEWPNKRTIRFNKDGSQSNNQKEVAERMKAGPGSKDYGALSLAVSYYAEAETAANVPRNCFIPRPNVDSTVIHLQKYKTPPVSVKDPGLMFRLIRASFNQRRKTLANGIKNAEYISFTREEAENALLACGLNLQVRGEQLGLSDFAKLSDVLS